MKVRHENRFQTRRVVRRALGTAVHFDERGLTVQNALFGVPEATETAEPAALVSLTLVGQAHIAEQRLAPLDRSRVRGTGHRARELADVATDLLVLGTREGCARQSHRAIDGTREGRYDAQRVHAGGRRFTPASRRHGRIRIVHHCSQTEGSRGANSLKEWLLGLDSNQQPSG